LSCENDSGITPWRDTRVCVGFSPVTPQADAGSRTEPPQVTRGYGLAFGHSERKAMAMSLVDRALRAPELGEAVESPAQMEEFVLSHSDNLEASGFVQHLKLPHYVDFQSELELVRRMRANLAQEGEAE
jgi:alpha-D-ribose 1-methylphosphonate 5-triphosphate synthase subunit PhnI